MLLLCRVKVKDSGGGRRDRGGSPKPTRASISASSHCYYSAGKLQRIANQVFTGNAGVAEVI